MMTRTEAFEYLKDRYHVDEMPHAMFEEYMRALVDHPHKPWCRTRLRDMLPVYGSDCTCGEG